MIIRKNIQVENLLNGGGNIFVELAESKILLTMRDILSKDRDSWTKTHPGMEYCGMHIEEMSKEMNTKLNWLWKLFIWVFVRGIE